MTSSSDTSSSNDGYKHMASPANGGTHSHEVRMDFSQHMESSRALKSDGSREHTLYDHDLVMIFPRREGGELKEPDDFTLDAFVALLTGKDRARSQRHHKVVIDPFARVLRTRRCFLDDHGRDLVQDDAENDHSEKAEQRRLLTIERLLESEYEKVVGSRQPTTELQFCELVAMAIARRVQLACGLTTRMFLSCDGDEVRRFPQ